MENEIIKRLMWTGLVAALGAAASFVADRSARTIWRRTFGEDPPA